MYPALKKGMKRGSLSMRDVGNTAERDDVGLVDGAGEGDAEAGEGSSRRRSSPVGLSPGSPMTQVYNAVKRLASSSGLSAKSSNSESRGSSGDHDEGHHWVGTMDSQDFGRVASLRSSAERHKSNNSGDRKSIRSPPGTPEKGLGGPKSLKRAASLPGTPKRPGPPTSPRKVSTPTLSILNLGQAQGPHGEGARKGSDEECKSAPTSARGRRSPQLLDRRCVPPSPRMDRADSVCSIGDEKYEDIEALEAGFVRCWVLSTGLLQKRTREISLAVSRSSLSGAAFSSTPLDSLLTKRATQIYLVCFLIWSFRVLTSVLAYSLNAGRLGPLTNFIVNVDSRRGLCKDLTNPGITTLGFSIDGKPLDSLSYETKVVGKNRLVVNFMEPDEAFINGWWFETGLETPVECDPLTLTVETSRNDMATSFKLLQKFSFSTQIRKGWVTVPEERGSNAFFDMRPDLTVYCDLIGYMLAVPGYGACIVFALLQKEETARILYMLAFGLNWSIINALICLVLWPMGMLRSDVSFYMLMLPCNIGFTLSLAIQRHFLLLNPLMSFYYLTIACYFTSIPAVINSVIMCVFWVYVHLHRYYTIRRSTDLMKPDKEQYDTMWQKITDSASGTKSILKLQSTVAKIQVHSAERPRQMQRLFTNVSALDDLLPTPRKSRIGQFMRRMNTHPEMFSTFMQAPLSLKKEEKIPLQTIDQLYAQAPYMDLVLRRKVQEWAWMSDGAFSVKEVFIRDVGSRYLQWGHCICDLDLQRKIKWCKVKSPDRAIEKIIRNYNRDASLLVDVVRQSIMFDDVEQMVTCLEAVRTDPQVQILRVKNRLDPEYDGKSSAGYRDVALNLCIVTEETRRLLLDMHVCEVQLVLRDFADIKTEDGHRRYISYRDLKGE